MFDQLPHIPSQLCETGECDGEYGGEYGGVCECRVTTTLMTLTSVPGINTIKSTLGKQIRCVLNSFR